MSIPREGKDVYTTFTPKAGEEEVLTAEKLLECIKRVSKDCPPLTPIVLDPHVEFVGGKLQITYRLRPEKPTEQK